MWKALIIIGTLLLALDLTYLFIFKDLMLPVLYKVQKTELKVNMKSAIACYIILVSGLYYFIIKKTHLLKMPFF